METENSQFWVQIEEPVDGHVTGFTQINLASIWKTRFKTDGDGIILGALVYENGTNDVIEIKPSNAGKFHAAWSKYIENQGGLKHIDPRNKASNIINPNFQDYIKE